MDDHIVLPAQFLDFPEVEEVVWSANFRQAHQVIATAYTTAVSVIRLDDSDPLRLQFHVDRLLNDICPLLVALEEDGEDPVPEDWLIAGSTLLAAAIGHLQLAIENAQGMCVIQST